MSLIRNIDPTSIVLFSKCRSQFRLKLQAKRTVDFRSQNFENASLMKKSANMF